MEIMTLLKSTNFEDVQLAINMIGHDTRSIEKFWSKVESLPNNYGLATILLNVKVKGHYIIISDNICYCFYESRLVVRDFLPTSAKEGHYIIKDYR